MTLEKSTYHFMKNIHDKFRLAILFYMSNKNTFIFFRKNVYNIVDATYIWREKIKIIEYF